MSTFKSALLGLGLVAGLAVAAHAQTGSVAALPPNAGVPTLQPTKGYVGPNPGSNVNAGMGQTQAVTASPAYVGPAPGAGNGQVPPRFQKSADWDQNTALHPYSSNAGPRAH